jgi:hypothetical protein
MSDTIATLKKEYTELLNDFTPENEKVFVLKRNIKVIKERIQTCESIFVSFTDTSSYYSNEFQQQAIAEKNRLCLKSSALHSLLRELEQV